MKELTTIQARLLALQDEAYRAFHKSLVPTLQQELIGVRVPQVRKLAKELAGTQESEAFLNELPHRFYEENLLHAIWLSAEKDFDRALSGIERFLPYVDNWAVCDAFSPKVFAKHPQEVLACIRRWLSSGRTYTIRFGVDMLMQSIWEIISPRSSCAGSEQSNQVSIMLTWRVRGTSPLPLQSSSRIRFPTCWKTGLMSGRTTRPSRKQSRATGFPRS